MLSLLPPGALLEHFDYCILLQELSMKSADPDRMENIVSLEIMREQP